jgi:hypothetical protein
MVGNFARAGLFAVLIASGMSLGCSDDDDTEEATESGSCNSIAAIFECSEVEGDSDAVAFEREYCDDVGDTWSSEPCPTADLIGCCFYDFGSEAYRDCSYVGHIDSAMTLEQNCVDSYGEWHAGSR